MLGLLLGSMYTINLNPVSLEQKVVILVVLTNSIFRFSLPISQLMATAIPVRGAKF
ncbi:hypothetical protein HH610_002485 [Escherichia coli]|nr:hypothetical protein [Escherichia coli]EFI3847241.1 hypothetical protein [Escherichia coli]EFI8980695.1 hypothetical protein [Escherichia coli]EFJ0490487.1 hypothetical protein [Escherichia coli]